MEFKWQKVGWHDAIQVCDIDGDTQLVRYGSKRPYSYAVEHWGFHCVSAPLIGPTRSTPGKALADLPELRKRD